VLDCYDGVVEYLMSGTPPRKMSKVEAMKLIRRVGAYQLLVGHLYINGKDEVLRRCVLPQEIDDILFQSYDGIVGGHFSSEVTTRKVLQVGL